MGSYANTLRENMLNYSRQVSVHKDWTSIVEEELLFASTAVDPVFSALLSKVRK
jgi:hypothetical protein|tara:strand:- start:228 stop:389 length:162 start_codon:yes stop_codon:yes gene_type:complete